MAQGKTTNKGQRQRGAAPKISLVMTGIGTFGLLALTVTAFIMGRMLSNGVISIMGSSSDDSGADSLLSLFSSGIDQFIGDALTTIAFVLLIFGVWCIIFWLICLRSKFHRVRDFICTIAGRIPVVILAVVLVRSNQSLSISFLGGLSAGLFVWAGLAILLSAVGWKECKSPSRKR